MRNGNGRAMHRARMPHDLLLACALLAGGGCARGPFAPSAAPVVRLEPVLAVPAPRLPAWIAAISPTGTADPSAQIRVRFASDLVPVGELGSPQRQRVLDSFALEPPLPGRFVLYTPRLVAFEADRPLVDASRFRVTLRAGLSDLAGDKLDRDLVWTFETAGGELGGLPAQEADAQAPVVALQPQFVLSSNVALDRASLAAHARFAGSGGGESVAAAVAVPTSSPSPSPQDESDATGANAPAEFTYLLGPVRPLAAGGHYRVVVGAGVLPERGNLATAHSFEGRFTVRGPLAFSRIEPYERPADNNGIGRFAGGAPQLDFTNPLDARSVLAAVHVSPAPLWPPAQADDGGSSLHLASAALLPHTHYTIRVDATLRDAFGQTLGAPVVTTFDTGALAADVWAPQGKNVFPADRNLGLNVYTTNLPEPNVQMGFRVVRPIELVDADSAEPADAPLTTLAPPASSVRDVAVSAARDAQTITRVPLRARLGGATGMLSYAISARTNRYRNDSGALVFAQPAFSGVVQLTNLGVFAQWFPHLGIVRVNHLSDGSPAAGAAVTVYESRVDLAPDAPRPPPQPCASGRADATGTLELSSVAFAPCAATSTSGTDAPPLLVVANEGTDWASVRTYSWSGGYDDGLNGGWSAGVPEQRGTIVSDRALYSPGESAYFCGISYFVTNGVLGVGRSQSFALSLEAPSGARTPLGTVRPDGYGVFPVTVPLEKDQELGYYTLHGVGSAGEELDGTFRVAEFKPPNFKVTLSLDRATAPPGSSVRAVARSEYLFGAPVAGARAQLNVTRSQTSFTPRGWDAWDFGREWIYPEEQPSVAPDVLAKDATIAADGSLAFDVPVAADLPFAMAYRVDAQTTDAANVAVSDSKSFTALPSDTLIGLSADFAGTAKSPLPVKVIVTDPNGSALSGKSVHLVLQRRTFTHATQIVEGSESPHDAVSYADEDSADLTSGSVPQTVDLTPKAAGEYRVRANLSAATADVTATDHELWVSGPGSAQWSSTDDGHVAVKLDKATYRLGDIATAVIANPYARADLDFAVIRSGVLERQRVLVTSAAPRVRFRVDESMLPNASVEALLVRRGPSLAKGVPRGLGQLASVGFAAFSTALDAKTLRVAVQTRTSKATPGAKQTVTVRLRGADAKPARGEVALMVVNDAVLQLTGYRPADLIATIYAEQSVSTRYADSRADVVLDSPERPLEKGFGFGGGFLAGSGDTRIRTNFKPVAYFNAQLHTDAAGNASATFTLPDDLTTWRVLALGFADRQRFGNGEGTFVATKPLIANVVLPQFARPGDTLDGGVSVTNGAGARGTLHVTGNVSGALAFSAKGAAPAALSLDVAAPATTEAYRFGMLVTGPQQAGVEFSASLDGATDAARVPLLVRTSDVLESTVQTGTTQGRSTVGLDVSPNVPKDAGGLEVDVASSIVPDVAEPLRVALADDSMFAWSLVGRADVAADALLLARTYHRSPSPAVRAALVSSVSAIGSARAADGGVAEYPGATSSDPYLDAFAFSALAHAQAAGVDTSPVLARLHAALLRTLANPAAHAGFKDEPSRSQARLATLAALAEGGELRNDFLDQIVAAAPRFTLAERFTLARLLSRLPAWSAQAAALSQSLQGTIAETSRSASVVSAYAGVEEQAAALRLFVTRRGGGDLIDDALNSLLGMRDNGTWGCSCGDAAALDALVAYASSLDAVPPNFNGALHVGPSLTRSFAFSGFASTQAQFSISMGDLPAGRSAVVLEKEGAGTLHYAVAYRYRIAPDAPGRYQGLRIDRIVRTPDQAEPVATFGIPSAAPLSLKAAQVFEIEDRIITDHAVDRVLIVDPLPAGMEAVDESFATSSQAYNARSDNWEIDYRQIYHDRVEAFARHLAPGVYALHFLVRTVTPGAYAWPAGRVWAERAPEEFGRTSAGRLLVQ